MSLVFTDTDEIKRYKYACLTTKADKTDLRSING